MWRARALRKLGIAAMRAARQHDVQMNTHQSVVARQGGERRPSARPCTTRAAECRRGRHLQLVQIECRLLPELWRAHHALSADLSVLGHSFVVTSLFGARAHQLGTGTEAPSCCRRHDDRTRGLYCLLTLRRPLRRWRVCGVGGRDRVRLTGAAATAGRRPAWCWSTLGAGGRIYLHTAHGKPGLWT